MKLIVGLGNPGEKHAKSRHNTGFMAVEGLVRQKGFGSWTEAPRLESFVIKTPREIIAKPQTFMNDSGRAVKKIADYFKIKPSDIWVIHDDLDIKLGEYKIQKGRGPKLHNGISSIERELGTEDFWRVRIGVDNRESQARTPGEAYVLQNFTPPELSILKGILEKVVKNFI